ncbi:sodium:solute symporter family transporter [Flavobacterium cellulosilyticum]|uniref:Na+/glucose cotransporter n=1 Tax=Flavobacterium cellulosilyticum TaxID=2541731 RepID=A0A4V2YZN0_9FLAO|nr:sodium/solute symporter [Flavobacterium cellulosilyticum]TDD97817.1 Na+/glucose cotransporter [Flavobacterium cellulosilyticum]
MRQISSFLEPVDYIIIVGYLLVLVAFGYYISFVKNKKSDENLFLAGNTLGWTSIGLNMWGTNVGPSMLIASASVGFTSGIVAGNFAWYAFVFILLLAVVFSPRYMGAKVLTLPEFMGKRFGDSTRNILAWYTLITILISWLSLTLFAGGVLVQQLLDLPMYLSVIMMVILSGFFAAAGGLKAIAYTNVFQMLLLIAVSLLLVVMGVEKAGGLEAIYAQTPGSYWNLLLPADDKNYPWIAIVLGYPIMGVWFWCTDQSMVQSVLGAKNLKEGQLGANFIGWLKILDVPLFILPGIVCYVLFPHLKNPDEAYMTMVTQLFPAGLRGLIIVVLIAALISTIGSALNSLSTVFTMDIYVKKYNPEASQKTIVKTGRLVVFFGSLLSIFITLGIDSIKGLNLFDIFQSVLGFIAPPMSVVFLFGVLWNKTTTKAANWTLTLGTFISIGIGVLYLWVFPNEVYQWPHFLLLSFYIFVGLSVMAYLITIFDKAGQKDHQTLLRINPEAKPDKQVKILWVLLCLVMVALYLIFNGH